MNTENQILEFLENKELIKIIEEYIKVQVKKVEVAYNIFSLSSYNAYLENFHSDIMQSLLDPEGLHKEGNTFLTLFKDYLNKYYNKNLTVSEFQNVRVTREEGRIDIAIWDESRKQVIIIENKMNNAEDQKEQLERYYNYAINERYKVRLIIYLSLDGFKPTPEINEELKELVVNVGAMTNQKNDLTNGWLIYCLAKCTNEDSKSLIFQYIKLIKHLANKNMEIKVKEDFYKFIDNKDILEKLPSIVDLIDQLKSYRRELFGNHFIERDRFYPFEHSYKFKTDRWILGGYNQSGNTFQLDILFQKEGSIIVQFWNTNRLFSERLELLVQKLDSIKMLDQFKVKDSYYEKYFIQSDQLKTLSDIGNEAVNFVNSFLEKLRKTQVSD